MSKGGSWFDRMLAASLPMVPKPIVRRVASRYVAGDSLADAVARARELIARGARVTMDVLGEEIKDVREGEATRDSYLELLDTIRRENLDGNISIKLTAFGLKLDPEVTYGRVRDVVQRARELDNFVRIDMEDSPVTSATIGIFRRLREEGFDNVGIVLQAYLRRTLADVEGMADIRAHYRLCKGIYVEPEKIAYKGYEEINANFLAVLERMFELGSYVGIATHDHAVVAGAEEIIRRRGLDRDAYEFQMLLGVDEALGQRLLADGHRLRVYVPFGSQWYAYCMRRLKENPKIGRYVLQGMFKG
ncbi:MAG: proline dehydrogenase family protein [Planctomycetes bacterium]|nr:proline dehydrogenase family protein [Planctomycetota bacterium]